jgi:co-chaperonin GroES (HSP10)
MHGFRPLLASEAEETTRAGIIISDTAKEKPMEGEILALVLAREMKGARLLRST